MGTVFLTQKDDARKDPSLYEEYALASIRKARVAEKAPPAHESQQREAAKAFQDAIVWRTPYRDCKKRTIHIFPGTVDHYNPSFTARLRPNPRCKTAFC
jgi:hypothetical protein